MRSRATDLPDEALLGGMAAGDDEAGTVFVRRYRSRVYGLALGIVADPFLAEDVAQEALVRAWRHAAVYDPRRGRVSTWVLTIARNLAIDTLRLRHAEPVDQESLLTLLPPAAGPLPEELAASADSMTRVRAALAVLAPEQRRALLLAAYCGRSASEIAGSEGIPLGTAKTRIRTALAKLRVALQESEA